MLTPWVSSSILLRTVCKAGAGLTVASSDLLRETGSLDFYVHFPHLEMWTTNENF